MTTKTNGETHDGHQVVLMARHGPQLVDWRELFAYRDLFLFLIWRQIKVRYAQSAIGIGWAIIQPLFSMLVFTIIFGNLAKIDSNGAPYALFSLAALLPWTYFSNALTDGVASLVSEANMLRKIYFPRLLLPLSSVFAKLVDFGIAAAMMAILMVVYKHAPSIKLAILPVAILLMILTAAGASIWLTALAVQYRDVKHSMAFLVQLGMYASPVVYPVSMIPDNYRLLYGINPMASVIECFRAGLLGTHDIPWDLLGVGYLCSSLLLVTGLYVFKSKERVFADVA